ncbi:type 2 isopentenyl-diphosphate Delta-isomerase [Lactobacillaceae bacterium L1_55_11]|nr:type 2 isopentenyl-diphosphate Delta-isomerase [Lactobacillaceae bacterium L1_55_11]
MVSQQSQRKNEHLSLAVKMWRDHNQPQNGAGFDQVRWQPNTLPELSVSQVDVSTNLLGTDLPWPFYIEAMTGGSEQGGRYNQQLAQAAKITGLAMAVGSQSIALKDASQRASFEVVRQENPYGFIMANLGADHSLANLKVAVDMIGANAIEIHVNVAQELSMAEGDRDFHWQDNLANLIAHSPVPVIIKEVGFGMSRRSLAQLDDLQPAAINIGGTNGTNFAEIEQARSHPASASIDLSHYGFSVVESLLAAQAAQVRTPLIATGGISNPNQVITALMLGAQATSSAGYFLEILARQGQEALVEKIEQWQTVLPKLMTLLGARDIAALQRQVPILSTDLQNFKAQL